MLPVHDDTHLCFLLLLFCPVDFIPGWLQLVFGQKLCLRSLSLPLFRKHTHHVNKKKSVGVFPHELSVSIVSERLWAAIHIRTRVRPHSSPPPFFSFLSYSELLSWPDLTANPWPACLEKGEGVCVWQGDSSFSRCVRQLLPGIYGPLQELFGQITSWMHKVPGWYFLRKCNHVTSFIHSRECC